MDLKNQKGITGIDIVIAITIISITTIAILAIYVNIIVGSKKVTRTSSATRIATSILENIDSMYYADVENELYRLYYKGISGQGITQGNYSESATYDMIIKSTLKEPVFNTKLNPGYDVELVVKEISSSTSYENSIDIANCPLVMEIRVIVKYEVSDKVQEVNLKTIKKRELLEECNEPNLNYLLGKEFEITVNGKKQKRKIESLNQIQPIKWSYNAENYVKTNASDEWYSYANKEWARVVITGVKETGNTTKTVFDFNTDTVSNIDNQTIFMWIPRFGKTETAEKEFAFAYGSSKYRIKQLEMKLAEGNSSPTFFYNGVAQSNITTEDINKYTKNESLSNEKKSIVKDVINGISSTNKENLVISNIFKEGETGVWVNISGGVCENVTINNELNNTINKSKYGPAVTHLGNEEKKYY